MTRNKLKTEKIELRVSPQTKEKVKKAAQHEGMSVTQWVELAIMQVLNEKRGWIP